VRCGRAAVHAAIWYEPSAVAMLLAPLSMLIAPPLSLYTIPIGPALEAARAEEGKIRADIMALRRTRRQVVEELNATLERYHRLLGGGGKALVGGDQSVGQGVQENFGADSLVPGDLLERLEEGEVVFHA